MATRSARDNKALNARHAEVLKAMLRKPENKLCADCKKNDPRWASTNLGCFMCIRCSGIHRSMGVHITRIKSIDLDTWTPEQVACVQRWGNKRANAYWEAHLRSGHIPPDHKIESFIRSKYESRRWAMEGPVPEPETLDDDNDDHDQSNVNSAQPVAAPQNPPPSKGATSKVASTGLNKAPASTSIANNAIDLFDSPSFAAQTSTLSPSQSNPSLNPASVTTKAANNASYGGGLFDLDFSPEASAAAVTATAPSARKDIKNDILSLYAAKPAQNYTNVGGQPTAINNQFNGLNLGTSHQTAPRANNLNNFSTLAQNNAFADSGNVWASPTVPGPASAQDPFGSFASATPSTTNNNNNKDVFSDIWN